MRQADLHAVSAPGPLAALVPLAPAAAAAAPLLLLLLLLRALPIAAAASVVVYGDAALSPLALVLLALQQPATLTSKRAHGPE